MIQSEKPWPRGAKNIYIIQKIWIPNTANKHENYGISIAVNQYNAVQYSSFCTFIQSSCFSTEDLLKPSLENSNNTFNVT